MTAKRRMRRGLAALLAGVLLVSSFMPASAITAGLDGYAAAGEDTYVSLHQYVTPTSIQDVYRVQLSVSGTIDETRNTEVVIVMDQSSSMNYGTGFNEYSSLSGNDGAYVEEVYAGFYTKNDPTLYFGEWQDQAYWLYPFRSDYSSKSTHYNNTISPTASYDGYYTGGNFAGGPNGWGYSYAAGIHDRVQFHTAVGTPPVTINVTNANHPYGASADVNTKLSAAAQGVNYAINTFSNRAKNPGLDRTSMGVVTFSGNYDTQNTPFWSYELASNFVRATGMSSYGFGELLRHEQNPDASWAHWIAGDPAGLYDSGVRYSTRMVDVAGSSYERYKNIDTAAAAAGVTAADPFRRYAASLAARSSTLTYVNKKYPTAGASSQDVTGLIPMGDSSNVAALKNDLATFVRAASDMDDGTWIYDGILEARNIFWGEGKPTSKNKVQPGAVDLDPDRPRRYVILLTDGHDTDAWTLDRTMPLITEMKNMGVTFMVIAVESNMTGTSRESMNWNSSNLTLDKIQSYVSSASNVNPDLNGQDYTPWLALASIPMSGEPQGSVTVPSTGKTVNFTGSGHYYAVGDIGTGLLSGMANSSNQIRGNASTPYTSMADAVSAYTGPAKLQQDGNAHFAYVHSYEPAKIERVFEDYVNSILRLGQGTYVAGNLNSMFSFYQWSGEPMFKIEGVGAENSTISSTKNSFNWELKDEIPLTGAITLTFYVKIDRRNAEEGMFYNVLDNATLHSFGAFYHQGDNPVPPYRDIDMAKPFPKAYLTLGGEIDNESGPGGGVGGSSGGGGSDGDSSSSGSGMTGAEGHQQNRTDSSLTLISGAVSNATPNITDIGSGVDSATGRTKVFVTLSNGSYMRYQWQYKNSSGEWVDIFGATGSHYTLGSQFTSGQEYELRCAITNPNGDVTHTDAIKVTAGKEGEELQTIQNENVADAGEEILVAAATSTNGQIVMIAAVVMLAAVAVLVIRSVRRRRG